MTIGKSARLADGVWIPRIGLGTWPLTADEVVVPVLRGLEIGYRAVDTACKYGNEEGVGRAIAASGIDRAEIFVTTKLDGRRQGDDRAIGGLDDSLRSLGLEYVDLVLIHWPLPSRDQYVGTWRTFERLMESGKARTIGVSNFRPEHLRRIIDETGVVPAVNQIELNPYVTRRDHRELHDREGIVTSSWSPLGAANSLLSESVIADIAVRHGRSAAQIVLRWHLQEGFVTMPKSVHANRLAENLDVFDFDLSEDEMAAIATLDAGPDAGVDSNVFGH